MRENLMRYRESLLKNEHAALTIEKYLHEAECLLEFLQGQMPTKEQILVYRSRLEKQYTARTVNNKLSAVNKFLSFLG